MAKLMPFVWTAPTFTRQICQAAYLHQILPAYLMAVILIWSKDLANNLVVLAAYILVDFGNFGNSGTFSVSVLISFELPA